MGSGCAGLRPPRRGPTARTCPPVALSGWRRSPSVWASALRPFCIRRCLPCRAVPVDPVVLHADPRLLLARDPQTQRSLSMALEVRRVRRTDLADGAGCGCMPGDATWCIPAPVSPSALTQEFLPGGGWPARASGGAARQGTGGGHWGGARPLSGAGLDGPGARAPEGVGPGHGKALGWCCHGRSGHTDAVDALDRGCGSPGSPGDLPAARGRSPGPDGVGWWGAGRSRVARGWLRPC